MQAEINTTHVNYAGITKMATEKPILNFVVDPQLLQRLEDFRFKNRFATRAAAVKWLLDWALSQKPKPAST